MTTIFMYWIEWGEWANKLVYDLFRQGAYSLTTDGCECIYWPINEYITVVYRMFA